MRLYLEGDRHKALCASCGAVRATTYRYRTVPFSDGDGRVEGILAAVCDHCDRVVQIPPQSTPEIRVARHRALRSMEARLPSIFVEALDLACVRLDPGANRDFRKYLFVHFVHEFASGRQPVSRLLAAHRRVDQVFVCSNAMPRKRLSLKISETAHRELEAIMRASSLSKTDTVKSVVVAIHEEIVAPDGEPALLGPLKARMRFATG